MCEPASFILTKENIYWSMLTDSHEDIIKEFGLIADGKINPNIARVEITPKNKNYLLPLAEWDYKLDQDILPSWYDPIEAEQRVRGILPLWFESKIILPGIKIDEIRDKNIVACYGKIGALRGNSQVGALRGNSQIGTLQDNSWVGALRENSRVGILWENSRVGALWENSRVGELRNNSWVDALWENSRVGALRENSRVGALRENSQIGELWDNSIARIFSPTAKVKKIEGEFAVVLDYTKKKIKVTKSKGDKKK
jgi:hypothetical protein